MRRVNNLADVQIILNELLDWKSLLTSKAKDQRGLQIKNGGDATDPTDLVTLRQLEAALANQKKTRATVSSSGGAAGYGEFSFEAEVVNANPGVNVMVNNFSVDLPFAQRQRVNFCYTPFPVAADLVVNVRITTDEGTTWTTIETLKIPLGKKHSWPDNDPPSGRKAPYANGPYTVLNSGDQLNFSVEAGSSPGLVVKVNTYA